MLHVANGHCTTRLIEQSGVPGRTMVWCDPLNEGPVPDVPDEQLLHLRAEFLAGARENVEEVTADLANWRAQVDAHDRYDELVLWYEHDLFDQLNLIQLLTHLGQRPSSKPVTLISIDSFPSHPHFHGIGELTAADVEGLFATRRPVTPEQYALAARAWAAYRSPDPRAIEVLLATDTSALPFLARALARHLEEFPSDTDGLSRSERRLMEQALEAPAEIRDAFPRMHDRETAHYISDSSFFDLANALATAKPALVTINLENPKGSEMPVGTIDLTNEGRDLLSGGIDRIKLCGIDRWLGGVHLAGRGPLWRWSARGAALIEA
jgi:hypothetical protein